MKIDRMVELLRSAAGSGSMGIVESHPICQVILPVTLTLSSLPFNLPSKQRDLCCYSAESLLHQHMCPCRFGKKASSCEAS